MRLTPKISPKDRAASCRRQALRWYRRNGRSLPWRETKDPYRIWISEIMLQQTQVSRVESYYRRFMKRYPNLQSLAKTNWRQLLPYWRGLGYYHRAKNILRTAQTVQKQMGGRFPGEEKELLALPGIGLYTAAAIRSFAFGAPVAAIDTNIARVVGRVFEVDVENIPPAAALLFQGARTNAAALNHALMDIGALICRARDPLCEICPVISSCLHSNRKCKPSALKPPLRKPRADIHVGAACIIKDGACLIAKRPQRKGGDWEFPGGKKEAGEDIRACLKREIKEELGIEIAVRPAFMTHDFLKEGRRIRIHFCRCQILRGKLKPTEHEAVRWIERKALSKTPLAKTNRAAAQYLARPEKNSRGR